MTFEVVDLKNDEGFQLTHKQGDETIELITSPNVDELVNLAGYLNGKYNELQVLNIAQTRLVEYYQTLITNIIDDKLSNVDNMYAMKIMLKETVDILGDLAENLEKQKEKNIKESKFA